MREAFEKAHALTNMYCRLSVFPTGSHTSDNRSMACSTSTSTSGPTASLPSTPPPHQLVKDAIVTTLNKQEFLATSTRARAVQMHGKRLLSLANNNVTFSGFCEDLVKVLGEMFQQIERCRSSAAKRERLWMAFHKLSVEKLPSMWKKLYTTLMHTDESELIRL